MYSAPYTREKATTPLIAFRRPIDTSIPKAKRKKWWDTDTIEDYENLFGYSYDQLKMSGDKVVVHRKARTLINKWFGWAHDNDDQGVMDRAENVSRDLLPVNYDQVSGLHRRPSIASGRHATTRVQRAGSCREAYGFVHGRNTCSIGNESIRLRSSERGEEKKQSRGALFASSLFTDSILAFFMYRVLPFHPLRGEVR